MGKIGILTDIHNNLAALETILAYFQQESCQEIFCCGDLIGIGPWPEETVALLRDLPGFIAVAGNHDGYLTKGLRFPWPGGMADGEAAHHFWEHGLLSPESKAYLKSLPQSLLLEREGVAICLCHYPQRGGGYGPLRQDRTEEQCRALFAEMPAADIYFYGHDHAPHQAGRYINPGSAGCPHSGRGETHCGVLTVWAGEADYRQVLLPYDLLKVIGKIERLRYSDYAMIEKVFYGVSV
ncbi:MAG: metallophosphoesterase family protein [Oscillospiraceae bacterium]|jgi:putative phosphoesterase|nr:metallophosphoesterase family protein [Oscillospiraceae bacterium]